MELSKYIAVFENAIDKSACDDIIKLFDTYKDKQNRVENNQSPNFTQFNITQNKDLHPELHQYLVKSAQAAISTYKDMVSDSKFWPFEYGFEQFRIKMYNKGKDQFREHVDSITLESNKRFLAFFWYLNDVSEGGETEFTNLGIKVKPSKGKLVMFPPYWLYPHIGHIPLSNDKYLLSSYLHIVK